MLRFVFERISNDRNIADEKLVLFVSLKLLYFQ